MEENVFPTIYYNTRVYIIILYLVFIPLVKDTKYHTATASVINNNIISICLYTHIIMVRKLAQDLPAIYFYYLLFYLIIFEYVLCRRVCPINYRCASYAELFFRIVRVNRILSPVLHNNYNYNSTLQYGLHILEYINNKCFHINHQKFVSKFSSSIIRSFTFTTIRYIR